MKTSGIPEEEWVFQSPVFVSLNLEVVLMASLQLFIEKIDSKFTLHFLNVVNTK